MSGKIRVVIFDLDGVLVDSEQVWDAARRQLTEDSGGRWSESATQDMMGMSSTEWSRYMNEELGVKMPPEEISAAVVKRMEELYREHLPLIPGAHEAVERVAAWWPLGLASSANRPVIEVVLELSGLWDFFETTVSSEEVARGKPAPDVYLEAARRLRIPATASSPLTPPGCALWPSLTLRSLPQKRPSRPQMLRSPPCRS